MSVPNDPTVTDSTADAPPRRRRRTSAPSSASPADGSGARASAKGGDGGASPPSPPRPSAGGRTLKSKLEEFFGSLAIPYATIGDTYAASLIAARTPALAEAWADLAKQNKGVERVLNRLLEGTAWGAVFLSSASIVIPLLAHHGILPLPVDPFAAMYGGESTIPGRGNQTMPGWSMPPASDDDYMTPPTTEGEPPGVFTVNGSNSRASMPPEAA